MIPGDVYAFDTVRLDILLNNLHDYGIRNPSHDWFTSYFSLTKHSVAFNEFYMKINNQQIFIICRRHKCLVVFFCCGQEYIETLESMHIVSKTDGPDAWRLDHYTDVIMSTMTSQITSLTIVYLTVYSGADQRNIKAPCHWSLCREFTGDRWIPCTKGQLRGK